MLRTIAIIFLVIFLSSCGKPPIKPIRPVQYITVSQDMISNGEKTFSGVVQSAIMTNLSFKVDGNIQSLPVKEGDFLKKGQLIATLDDIPYDIIFQETEAQSGQANSRYKNAIKYYARLAKLYQEGAISDRQLDDARAEAEYSAQALKLANKQNDYEALKMSYTKLYAPMDGYVAKLDTELNENVKAGSSIITFISAKEIEVKTNIPENYINSFKKNQKVKIKLDAIPEKTFSGYVADIGVDSLMNYSTYPVSIKIINPPREIKSGMSAQVSIMLNANVPQYLIIPLSAVLEENGQTFVYTLKSTSNSTAEVMKTPIKTGELDDKGIQIKSGLKPKDKLVTAGVNKIQVGMIVKINQKGTIDD